MDYKTVTIKEARDNFSEIIEKVAIGGESFIVTKFGKVKAKISPLDEQKSDVEAMEKKRKAVLKATFGMWKDREDMKDGAKWVEDLRNKESSRHGKIFS